MVKTKRITIHTESTKEVRNLSDLVSSAVLESRVREGIAVVHCLHTTTGLLLANYDPTLKDDIARVLDDLVPNHPDFRHNQSDAGPPNAAAHLKCILTGSGVTLPILGGRLALGDWQAIYLAEFEGPRTRTILVQTLGDG